MFRDGLFRDGLFQGELFQGELFRDGLLGSSKGMMTGWKLALMFPDDMLGYSL